VTRPHPLELILGHHFADPDLLAKALTHRGALGMQRPNNEPVAANEGNERLEFLGDRVLGLVIADTLLKTFPNESEGDIAPRFAALVSAATLVRVAQDCGLQAHVKVARGQGTDNDTSVLADACEAIIGALYCDGGLDAAQKFITKHWQPLIYADLVPPKDAKTALQEWAQARGLPLPAYKVVESSGPAHAPSFNMTVTVQGFAPVTGHGRTKRLATQAAATALLKSLPEEST